MVANPAWFGKPARSKKGKPVDYDALAAKGKLVMATFRGGALDGRLTRVVQLPEKIPHIHRMCEAYLKDALPEQGGAVVGKCLLGGEPAILLETRNLYVYRRTSEIHGPMRAQVYELESGPVPAEWDDVKGEWKPMEVLEEMGEEDLVSEETTVAPGQPD
jgi:hypothetical protein